MPPLSIARDQLCNYSVWILKPPRIYNLMRVASVENKTATGTLSRNLNNQSWGKIIISLRYYALINKLLRQFFAFFLSVIWTNEMKINKVDSYCSGEDDKKLPHIIEGYRLEENKFCNYWWAFCNRLEIFVFIFGWYFQTTFILF